jgi:hypothetical protein
VKFTLSLRGGYLARLWGELPVETGGDGTQYENSCRIRCLQHVRTVGDEHTGDPLWPLGLFFASISIVSMAYLAWHGMNWLRSCFGRREIKLEPIHLIVFGLVIAAAGVGWQWSRGAAPVDRNELAAPATTVTSPPQSVPTTKYYSRSEREELSDLCRRLRDLLIENGGDGGGGGVYAKTAKLHNDWLAATESIRSGISRPVGALSAEIMKLRVDLAAARASIAQIKEALFGNSGITDRFNKAYPDEFTGIIGQGTQTGGIADLSANVDVFDSAIAALGKAAEFDSAELAIHIVRSSHQAAEELLKSIRGFQKWEFETVRRIDTFRSTLQG